MPQHLTKQDICKQLPHAGTMCLLDTVTSYDETNIRCISNSHLHADNPLRTTQEFSSINGVEYAAQAMIMHSRLLKHTHVGQAGYLAALRNVIITEQYLDDHQSELIIDASLHGSSSSGAIYTFSVSTEHGAIISGRITLMTTNEDLS